MDVVNPDENYTVGVYQKQADEAVKEILSKGKVPIITGGTGFYVKALLEGLDLPEVRPNVEYRNQLRDIAQEKGREFLHQMLAQSDPTMAQKLHPNDSFRIIRALEVQKATGEPMSKVQALKEPQYNVLYAGLNAENRDYLYDRINRLVHVMLELGLERELKI
ncbi:MAG: hypothetical protein MZV64_26540 [Ignavibacteriales bacterium]|nr:hypothetical protein [Ignavibacteriales bacterium]